MDYNYWNEYYKKNIAPKDSSEFAKFCMKYIKNNNKANKLLELGCGNGRDSIFFYKNGLNVLAIDQSDVTIDNLKEMKLDENINFVADNFIETKYLNHNTFDYIYSRFTMHSITENEEDILLKKVYDSLKKGGLFFVEARSVNDSIYGLGKKIAKNTYIHNNHCRRFIVLEELLNKLRRIGFCIVFDIEGDNFAIYKEENPKVVRVIAKK